MSRPYLREDRRERVAVADVDVVVRVRVAELAGEPQHVPCGGSLLAEELGAHVVVDADHVQAQAGEVPDRLGADQTRRSGDQCDAHVILPFDRRSRAGSHVSRASRRRATVARVTFSNYRPNRAAPTPTRAAAAARRCLLTVGKEGVEPSRPFGHTDLNRARLPFRHFPAFTQDGRTGDLPSPRQPRRKSSMPPGLARIALSACNRIPSSPWPRRVRKEPVQPIVPGGTGERAATL